MSKIVEKLVSGQLVGYLQSSNLMPCFQSAYRRHHSTETALLRVISDIVGAVDRGCVTLLGLLDLSAAFDTVDHTILLDRLRIRFGVGGGVLGWIRTFLVGRTQQVLYMGRLSSIGRLDFGVPQGSVLGPLFFLLYTAELFEVINKKGLVAHSYADDTQVHQPPNHRSQLGSSRSASRRSAVRCGQTDSKWTPTKPSWFGSERASSCQRSTSMRSNCSWTRYRSPHLCQTLAWFLTTSSRWHIMSRLSIDPVSFNCARYVRSGGRWGQMPGKRWWMHSLWVDWTTATPCVRASMKACWNRLQHIQNAAAG